MWHWLRRICEPAKDGSTRTRVVVDLTATKGVNCHISRQSLSGITPDKQAITRPAISVGDS